MSGNQAGVGPRYLSSPTCCWRWGGLRLLTDPTFDPPGDFQVGNRVLRKTIGALVTPDQAGPVDGVLLSHDQHPENLDSQGRGYLNSAPLVLSTAAAQQRLGGTVQALENWQRVELPRAGGAPLRVTGVPARHGPPGCESVIAPVTGFVLSGDGLPDVYVSGDNAGPGACRRGRGPVRPGRCRALVRRGGRTDLLDGAYLTLTSA